MLVNVPVRLSTTTNLVCSSTNDKISETFEKQHRTSRLIRHDRTPIVNHGRRSERDQRRLFYVSLVYDENTRSAHVIVIDVVLFDRW
jgi:hypothetical protein